MAKRKSVDAAETVPGVAEPTKPVRKAAAKPKSTGAVHKHHSKKSNEPLTETPMAKAAVVTQEAIAQLAYSYWQTRGFESGSPEQDWLRAEQELLKLA